MKPILVDAWNTFVTKDGINNELKRLLDNYPNKKIIVTNANDNELITFGIINMPYPVFSLSHKPNKTNPEYFKQLFLKYRLSRDSVVYFEHNEEAIKSAKSLSIKSFWQKPNTPLDQLKLFLDSNL